MQDRRPFPPTVDNHEVKPDWTGVLAASTCVHTRKRQVYMSLMLDLEAQKLSVSDSLANSSGTCWSSSAIKRGRSPGSWGDGHSSMGFDQRPSAPLVV